MRCSGGVSFTAVAEFVYVDGDELEAGGADALNLERVNP